MSKRFAFISPDKPTYEQVQLAKELGITLVETGDEDAFSPEAGKKGTGFDGVIVINPAAALNYILKIPVGIFEKDTKSLRVWNIHQIDDAYYTWQNHEYGCQHGRYNT